LLLDILHTSGFSVFLNKQEQLIPLLAVGKKKLHNAMCFFHKNAIFLLQAKSKIWGLIKRTPAFHRRPFPNSNVRFYITTKLWQSASVCAADRGDIVKFFQCPKTYVFTLQHPNFNKTIDEKTGFESRDLICHPIVIPPEDRVIGVVEVVNKKTKEPFSDEDEKVSWYLYVLRGKPSGKLSMQRLAQVW